MKGRYVTTAAVRPSFRFSHKQSVGLVFLCTFFGVAAQYLIKSGASQLHTSSVLDMIRIPSLVAGYSLYGISTALLILALRDGELSLLYPVISLTYVWVTVLSILVFKESVNAAKLCGVATICLGVTLLGTGSRR